MYGEAASSNSKGEISQQNNLGGGEEKQGQTIAYFRRKKKKKGKKTRYPAGEGKNRRCAREKKGSLAQQGGKKTADGRFRGRGRYVTGEILRARS